MSNACTASVVHGIRDLTGINRRQPAHPLVNRLVCQRQAIFRKNPGPGDAAAFEDVAL